MTIDPDTIIELLYDIALDPKALDSFIDVWNDAGLDRDSARQLTLAMGHFDGTFQTHLRRADTFLNRNIALEERDDMPDVLAQFGNLAAFVIDARLRVSLRNEGAAHFFGIEENMSLALANLPADAALALPRALKRAFAGEVGVQTLVRVEREDDGQIVVFQICKLAATTSEGEMLALVVTTYYHWNDILGHVLSDVFGLTLAEQGVVRSLVEGRSAKEIATTRGTSEGTVRGQIKSILAKMNARSQSEIIRLVLSLRDVSTQGSGAPVLRIASPSLVAADWLNAEVWKPFQTLTLPDGRRMDYHDMGPVSGAPVLYTHMGYCQVRWIAPMLKLAYQLGLRVICPIRAGYGQSDNISSKADILRSTTQDTLALLDHLGIARLPYVSQGNDLIFAAAFAGEHPDKVTEIIGLSARPYLHGDLHYSGMGKWHRFFLSTAKHSPHLVHFTTKAAIAMARRYGVETIFMNMQASSAADLALVQNPDHAAVMRANGELVASKTTNAAQAYAMEISVSEAPWDHLLKATREIPTWFVIGAEDPATDLATIAAYREAYPWIEIEVMRNAGQMLIFQHYDALIPRLADAARRAREAS